MRQWLTKIWICLPLLFMLLHWTRGSHIAARDTASLHVTAALEFEKQNNWSAAEHEYEKAMQLLPDADGHQPDRVRVQLAIHRSQARSGKIMQALGDMRKQRDEMAVNRAPSNQLDEIRNEIAVTSYYAAWLLRREGAARGVWEPLAESARQDFRYLAEQTSNVAAKQSQQNLECVISFARSSDELFRTKGLPDESLASNQNVGAELEAAEDEEQSSQRAQEPGRGQRPGDKPSNSGGNGTVTRRGS